jgi:hypothetical protein
MGDSSSMVMWIFSIITLLYFILKFILEKDEKNKKAMMAVLVIYLLLVGFVSFGINNATIKEQCGESKFGLALTATLIPWSLLFGLLNLFFLIFPGWKAPFSNTFGYLVVRMWGIQDVFNELFKNKIIKSSNDQDKKLNNALEQIYSDKSLLINQITPGNFDNFWLSMSNLFKDKNNTELKNKLKELVTIKDLVSEFIWYILTGLIATSVSYNYIVNSNCNPSLQEIENKQKKWDKEKNKDKEKGKTYYNTE